MTRRRAVATVVALCPMIVPAPMSAQYVAAPATIFVFTGLPAAAHAAPARASLSVTSGYGERTFPLVAGGRLEQRAQLQLALASRLSLVAAAGMAGPSANAPRGSLEAELLGTFLRSASATGVLSGSAGLGVRREYGGADVALGRVVAARVTGTSAAGVALLIEQPMRVPAGARRDAADLMLTSGWRHVVGNDWSAGLEIAGQDLEGFWEEEEAEGGATLFVGPTLGLAPARRNWSVLLGTGPVVRATRTIAGTGSAPGRLLAPDARAGYVTRLAVSFAW